MADVLSWLSHYGAWGLLIVIVILLIIFYDKLERPIAKAHDCFSWARASWRKRAIKADIQSHINSFCQSVDHEVPNTMPYNMKLQFVADIDRAELRDKNVVLVRIRDRRHDDKNFVHAMLTFCPVGVLIASRLYLDDSLSNAIDFTVTRKFLNAIQYQSALTYLHQEILEPEIAEKPELDKLCNVLDRLDEQGLFTKVILRELRDFGAKVESRYPTEAHKKETRQFVEYMDVIATRAPREDCDTQFQGAYISMGFVFVGTAGKIQTEGLAPYLRAIQYKKGIKIERIYMAARDQYLDKAERLARLAEKRGFGKIVKKPMRYHATNSLGQRREHIIIEMQLIPCAPFAPPEQGRLLED